MRVRIGDTVVDEAPPRPGIDITPNPGPQYDFVTSPAYEVLLAGSAGASKSFSLLLSALRGVDKPDHHALLLRRTFPELERSLILESRKFFESPSLKGRYNEQKKTWVFPSGARVSFAHLESDSSVHGHQSAAYTMIGFDEATSFTREQFVYMTSRARSAAGLPVRIRLATNPGGIGEEWVMDRYAPWLRTKTAAPSTTLWCTETDDGTQWVPKGTPKALSRRFIFARLSDNPWIERNDPAYRTRLEALDRVTRKQLLDGLWGVRPAAGLYFKASYFPVVLSVPRFVRECRYWDRAASPKGDWTVGLRAGLTSDGTFVILDVVRFRGSPAEVQDAIVRVTRADGDKVTCVLEQDPGQAGVFETDSYVRLLRGHEVRTMRVTKDKITRARPISAYAEQGRVQVLRGDWVRCFLDECEEFPDGAHDDQVDTLSGAFAWLTGAVPATMDDYAEFQRGLPGRRM